jgi:hypothetical protein
MNIKVLVEPGEDGYFVAHVPALKVAGHRVRPKRRLSKISVKQSTCI